MKIQKCKQSNCILCIGAKAIGNPSFIAWLCEHQNCGKWQMLEKAIDRSFTLAETLRVIQFIWTNGLDRTRKWKREETRTKADAFHIMDTPEVRSREGLVGEKGPVRVARGMSTSMHIACRVSLSNESSLSSVQACHDAGCRNGIHIKNHIKAKWTFSSKIRNSLEHWRSSAFT